MVYVKVFIFISLGVGFFTGAIFAFHGFEAALLAGLNGGPGAGIFAVVALALVRNLSKRKPRFGDVSHSSVVSLNLSVEEAYALCKASLAGTDRPQTITHDSALEGEIAAVLEPAGQHTTKDKVTLKIHQLNEGQVRVSIHSQPRSWPVVWDNNSNFKNIRKIAEYLEQHAS